MGKYDALLIGAAVVGVGYLAVRKISSPQIVLSLGLDNTAAAAQKALGSGVSAGESLITSTFEALKTAAFGDKGGFSSSSTGGWTTTPKFTTTTPQFIAIQGIKVPNPAWISELQAWVDTQRNTLSFDELVAMSGGGGFR